MPSRLKTKKLHESASSRVHFLQILQSTLLAKVAVAPSISMGTYAQNFAGFARPHIDLGNNKLPFLGAGCHMKTPTMIYTGMYYNVFLQNLQP